ncbi:MAG: RNA-binding transcriptional accessory protein [Flavobacteriia bacterium]|nr:RNA-binding transcriptional accessory protein [Flavobacteriia bacterium]OJX37485.1 MAG: RNA-binding transcriptional accessory protein [Flavobacteriia bacterium 40-80]
MNITAFVQKTLAVSENSISNTLMLLEEGATIPFIARYRKEKTGGLDEVEIARIRDEKERFEELTARQKTILKAIEEQGKLTEELKSKITTCFDASELEDIYLPFKQKKQTKGEKAKKLGLEPLAKMILSQRLADPYHTAASFVKGEVESEEQAVEGALHIIAEYMNENAVVRQWIRELFRRKAVVQTKLMKGKTDEGEKYKDLYDFSMPLWKVPSHRFLAIHRGHREGILSLKAVPEKEEGIEKLVRFYVKGDNDCRSLVEDACKDAYTRLIAPSIENEIYNEFKLKADEQAIAVFSKNLKQLLLAPPLGQKRILAIDPGFRTGCKVVCIDEYGELLTNTAIFPHPPQNERDKAMSKLTELVEAYKIEVIAIGDGTAGRETETLVKRTRFTRLVDVYVVREDGASVYSASPVARKEFPNHDVTVRGAVSIGRRLMDPLAELVKIDPKSIGVGQYQHEVNQPRLKVALDDVVVSAVNAVGVELNTTSPYLLSYVSGLNSAIAENIVAFRSEIGGFTSRQQLKKVKRLGDKAFEQCAGFLRIRDAENPLDNSAVHPESYRWVEKFAGKLNVQVQELIGNEQLLNSLKNSDFEGLDSFTFTDLVNELKKPARDPRRKIKVLEFDEQIKEIKDLKIGQKLNGIITNVTAFGAFVNIGIKENGLIHKSNLADKYVEDPSDIVALHQHVSVEIIEIDIPRKRIGLKKV